MLVQQSSFKAETSGDFESDLDAALKRCNLEVDEAAPSEQSEPWQQAALTRAFMTRSKCHFDRGDYREAVNDSKSAFEVSEMKDAGACLWSAHMLLESLRAGINCLQSGDNPKDILEDLMRQTLELNSKLQDDVDILEQGVIAFELASKHSHAASKQAQILNAKRDQLQLRRWQRNLPANLIWDLTSFRRQERKHVEAYLGTAGMDRLEVMKMRAVAIRFATLYLVNQCSLLDAAGTSSRAQLKAVSDCRELTTQEKSAIKICINVIAEVNRELKRLRGNVADGDEELAAEILELDEDVSEALLTAVGALVKPAQGRQGMQLQESRVEVVVQSLGLVLEDSS